MKLSKLFESIKKEKEHTVFLILFIIMAIYYGYRLFALIPWYDELYTYYYFISRGPIYAAIHWPVPNNHVGYSVLSALLDLFGNSYIGLRGISYLCALANIGLIYQIGKKVFQRWISIVVVVTYISMNLVNNLAVQGRGYTLGITCFLGAIWCLFQICDREQDRIRDYILFGISLTLALYTVPSHVYFVIPVCIAGGIYLLISIKIHRLIRLMISSVIAALSTVFLYAVIWLAIGSNLLIKDSESIYFGMGHAQMILKAPFAALQRGIDYMLASPYIQSVSKEGFIVKLVNWFQTLLGYYFDGLWLVVFVVILLGMIQLMIHLKDKNSLLPIILLCSMIAIPLFLTIQRKLPYYRVFAYGGVLVAFSFGYLLQSFLRVEKLRMIAAALMVVFALSRFLGYGYQAPYGARETQIADGLKNSRAEFANDIRVTDCTEQYMIKFLYGNEVENQDIIGADYLLLDKKMMDQSFQEMEWEFYHYYNTIPWDYVKNELKPVYENEGFIAYSKQ